MIMIDITPNSTFLGSPPRLERRFVEFIDDNLWERTQGMQYRSPAVGLNYFDYSTGKRTQRGLHGDLAAYSFLEPMEGSSFTNGPSISAIENFDQQRYSVIEISRGVSEANPTCICCSSGGQWRK
ncbi:hypothetical protein BGX28_006187, partial [Mortierella sp. GBA30]